jgi:hypothetical protein
MKTSENINEISKALSCAQGEMKLDIRVQAHKYLPDFIQHCIKNMETE